jgi:SpoVK/Ycf46/Vps4 family AAA+-type ATPase
VPTDARRLIELTDAALAADYTRVRRAANAIARVLAERGDIEAAEELRSLLRKKGVPLRSSGYAEQLPVDAKSRLPLVEEQPWPSAPIFLNGAASSTLQDFIADVHHVEELSRQGLSARLCLLLSGPPGTGKSLLAGHVAVALKRPLYVVRLDSMISSLLGDTAKNVRAIFDFAPGMGAVLFLDEMDAVAKLRDDRHELGELKRVVNTVLQGLDALDDRTVVIGATNHPQLLDQAIWRRFPYKIDLGPPDRDVRTAMWQHFLFSDREHEAASPLAEISDGLSGADIETIAHTARRHSVLGNRALDLAGVAEAVLRSASGVPTLPTRDGLPPDARRNLALGLSAKGLNAPKIGELLGISRQWALKLLKNEEDSDG